MWWKHFTRNHPSWTLKTQWKLMLPTYFNNEKHVSVHVTTRDLVFTSRSMARGSMSWLWQRGMRALALPESERAYWDVLGCPTSSLQKHVIHFAIKTLLTSLNLKVLGKFLDICDPELWPWVLNSYRLLTSLKILKNWKKYKKQYLLWFILMVNPNKKPNLIVLNSTHETLLGWCFLI